MKSLTSTRILVLAGAIVAILALSLPAHAGGKGHGRHGHHKHSAQKRSHVDRLYQLAHGQHASLQFKFGSSRNSISLAENVWRIGDAPRSYGHHGANRYTPQRYRYGVNPDFYRLRHIGSGGYGNVIYIDSGARVFNNVQDDTPSVFTKDDAETLIYGREQPKPKFIRIEQPARPATQEAVTVHRTMPDGSVKTIITSRPIGDEDAPTALARAEAVIEEQQDTIVENVEESEAETGADSIKSDQVLAKDSPKAPDSD